MHNEGLSPRLFERMTDLSEESYHSTKSGNTFLRTLSFAILPARDVESELAVNFHNDHYIQFFSQDPLSGHYGNNAEIEK